MFSYVQGLESRIQELNAQLLAASSPTSQQALDIDTGKTLISLSRQESVGGRDDDYLLTNREYVTGPHTDENGDTTVEAEITDVNQHTNAVEFHGSTSSMALLGSLQRRQSHQPGSVPLLDGPSLVSALHNSAFSPKARHNENETSKDLHVEQAHTFIAAYFENLHYVHPLIDKEHFMSRANDLWFGRSKVENNSFIALYLSLMSLGALVREWSEEKLDGLTRFEWSRKLFGEAQEYLNYSQFSNDLATVPCLYIMVCQSIERKKIILLTAQIGQSLSKRT
jgi:hypothetical protein